MMSRCLCLATIEFNFLDLYGIVRQSPGLSLENCNRGLQFHSLVSRGSYVINGHNVNLHLINDPILCGIPREL
mgnify:FL=1